MKVRRTPYFYPILANRIPMKNNNTEALPFYWLAQALYNILASDPSALDSERNNVNAASTPPAGSWNKFAGMDFKQMLQSARVFVSPTVSAKIASLIGCIADTYGRRRQDVQRLLITRTFHFIKVYILYSYL